MEEQCRRPTLNFKRAFVVDDQEDVRQFITTTALAEQDIEIESFQTANSALAALGCDHPAIIFLDVALLHSDAIDVLIGLGAQSYAGVVHLMSAGRPQLVAGVQRLGLRHGVRLAKPLSKPVQRDDLLSAIAEMRIAVTDAPGNHRALESNR
jgi:FixJ family two-component response regulator